METFTLLWRSQLAPTPRARRRTKTRTRNLFGTTAVSRQISAHTQQLFDLFKTSAIQEAWVALYKWLSHLDFTDPVVLVSSHLPSEEHTQEKISEDGEKEGFDIFISLPSFMLSHLSLLHPVWWSITFLGCLPIRHLYFIKQELVKVKTKIYI